MAIRKIARMGHPVLRQPAKPIAEPAALWVRALIKDMIETMADAGGAGLAAPQVHEPWRLVIFHAPEGRDGGAVPLTVLINPEIEVTDPAIAEDWEGCLSVPGLRGLVPRPRAIRYRGLDGEGNEIAREAEGFHARVVQHECDHLDGVLYPQRMTDLDKLIFESEWRHWIAAGADRAEEAEI